ncbi:cilia- and flagella-associated protein 61 [Halichoeres trimaculatus]|uniref:cilia- and flagella-associated protein 61 n=1 Tax=Halichoeres trimaculatus TaxID=147232 RepID=UPI003D9DD1BA
MRTITSASGQEEAVTVRRSESADAERIDCLISLQSLDPFGRVNIIHLLEKANLAVTLANDKDDILAHASFFDYPVGDLVDQTQWEPFLQKNFQAETCTPLNTLFLHLYVAQPDFAKAGIKEILRAVFNAVAELEHICLISPFEGDLEPALEEVFEHLEPLTDPGPQCLALICHREEYFPRLQFRPARAEDHDDIMPLIADQTKQLSESRPYFLVEIVETQNEQNHSAVCESNGVTVGFISVTSEVDLIRLNDSFDLREFDGLYKMQRIHKELFAESDSRDGREEPTQAAESDSKDEEGEQNQTAESDSRDEESEPTRTAETDSRDEEGEPTRTAESDSRDEESEPTKSSESDSQQEEVETQMDHLVSKKSNAFCIQFFGIDKSYEMRSVEFLPYVFNLFPDRDFCIITVPTLSPVFPLLQNFYRMPHPANTHLQDELYIFHRDGLRNIEVRPAVAADRPAVSDLVKDLRQGESLLKDLDCFYEACSDLDGVTLQAFVAQVNSQVVGILIIRDELDMEYIRSHYNIENFIYFSHHRYEEHAQIQHFVLEPSFQHFSKHVFKEVLRLAHRSCLYLRIYPSDLSQENSCVHHLESLLNCAVPVRPRRQIIYPLEELGINAPSRQITEDQAPFALSLISRKLTMEPKVIVNARIVVVGASDTGLSFLEALCFCPHLKFNHLTLISTHGLPRDCDHDDVGFLSTSHAYSSRDIGQLALETCVTVVTGKMIRINRKSKNIVVSGGKKVAYDHLILCTGLQYQVPCPTDVDLTRPVNNNQLQTQFAHSRYTKPVPSNLFTLNDLHDCRAARRWLRANFVDLEDNAIVYGNSIDVFTTVETLLSLGVQGGRIHLVLPPPHPVVSCFTDPHVKKAVNAALQKAKVQVHHNCLLAQMNNGEHTDPLTCVSFSTDAEPLHLQCGVFINLSNKGVDSDAFKSINSSFLVFDSRLVINTAFQTRDPSVYAAGPFTKFSRCYHADEWTHSNFNSKEVGQDLAALLLPLFDPTLEENQPETDRHVRLYEQAKIQGGKLPGGLNYLHVTKPSATILPGAAVKHLQDQGISTGRVETGNYFCIHLDSYELVGTLTCLSLKPLPVSNYLSLYGKHQQLLGQLSTYYYQGLIPDLYSFFRQSWCLPIYHDRFSDFEQELQQITSAKDDEWKQQLMEDEDDPGTHPEMSFKDAESRAAVRSSAVKYLTYNRNLLPMFTYPGQL